MQLSDRIGRRMKLHDLHVLMAVAQVGSMSKAAQLLNTTQPAISRSIADLEHAIGVRLLDRRRHGVELTEHGRAMRDGGVAMFDELRQAVKNIEFLSDPTAGEVRIGTTPPLAASFVSAVIDRLSQRHPRIVFHVVTEAGEAQRRNLSERSVDLLIFRRTSDFADEQVSFEKLYESPYVVAAGSEQSMGAAAPDRACRTDGGIMGATAAERRVRIVRRGRLSRWRVRLSPRDRGRASRTKWGSISRGRGAI